MSFTNMGEMGYNAILLDETVSFQGPKDRLVKLTWNNIYDNIREDNAAANGREYSGKKAAGPRVIPARDAITHETEFIPVDRDCSDLGASNCNTQANVLHADKELYDFFQRQDRLELLFAAKTSARNTDLHTDSCYIRPKSIDFKRLQEKPYYWTTTCFPGGSKPKSWSDTFRSIFSFASGQKPA
jgi:hypothetical protein